MFSTVASILEILGSLGVFLFGMKVMSEGVQKFAGAKMRSALSSVTDNRVSGVFTGLVTTGLVQSSSATTVLVVSLVNAGLLTLVQSIGVIMGANLGTTLTAWIVASIGKFSLSKIAIPIVGIGFPMFFVGKARTRAIGEFLIGFGLLFLGLNFLKDSVPELKTLVKTSPDTAATIQYWIDLFKGAGYFAYVLFMIGGIVLTLIVQSSSAAMAITITCAVQGWFGDDPLQVLRYSAAVVLGENIGTTVTAWLASLGANTNAKRAARAHFLFNVIGVIWMLIAFIPFTAFVWWLAQHLPEAMKSAKKDWGASEVAFATAIFHTSFNLINTFVLIWFVPQIANTVRKWVKEGDAESSKPRLKYISQNLVDLGELNLAEAEQAVKGMSQECNSMFEGYQKVFANPTDDLSAEVSALKQQEEVVDLMMQDITEYLVKCSAHDVGPRNAAHIASLIRIVAELEECADGIYRLVMLVRRKYNKNREFSPDQMTKVQELSAMVGQILRQCDNHLLRETPEDVLNGVKDLQRQVSAMRKQSNKAAMKRMAEGNVKVEMLNTEINNHLQGIGNNALHILQESTADEEDL